MSVHDESLPHVRSRRRARSRGGALLGGGVDGNEVLTTATGIILLIVLAALGITIIRIGQLIWEHLFIGLLLLGPVLLKMGSTGYRFAKYYLGNPVYVRKGPPWMPLRLLAPGVVLTNLGVFLTGILLLAVGPVNREPWLLLHKATFVLWLIATGLHVLGHIPEVGRLLGVRGELVNLPGVRTDLERFRDEASHPGEDTPPTAAAEARVAGGPGSAGRLLLLLGSIVVGVVLAIVVIPDFHTWTHWMTTFRSLDH